MRYPTTLLTDLSVNAQTLYKAGRGSLKLDRDWLTPGAHRMSEYAFREELKLDPDIQPTEELLTAMAELVDGGYAWHMYTNSYGLQPVDQQIYTVASGDGPWLIKVSRVSRPGIRAGEDGVLIAVLDGATLETRTDRPGGTQLNVTVTIPGATDPEHSPAYAANISLLLPTFPQIYGRQVTFWGIAETAHLYPLGTDPRLLDDRTHEALNAPVPCMSEHCQGGVKGREPHVIAPYLPPAVDLQRSVLCVEAYIRKPNKKKRRTSA